MKRGILIFSFLLLLGAVAPAASSANFAIEPGSVQLQFLDSGGNPDLQAGGHPDRLVLDFKIETTGGTAARDLAFEYAPGLTGSPVATKTCPRWIYEFTNCPDDTQVGYFSAAFLGGETFKQPIWNMAPAQDQLAAIAFKPFWETEFELNLRPNDYGLNIATKDMPQLPFNEGHVVLWGIPADHNGAPLSERAAFLTNPTKCGPLQFILATRSWEPGSEWLRETAETASFTGCEELPFEPDLGFELTNPAPDSPTGAKISVNLTEHSDPNEPVSANLKDVRIDLPPGVTVSPGGVQGRESCTDEQFGVGTESPVTCPFQARVGSVEIGTPQLGENLRGAIYLGQEKPGQRFRLFVDAVARGVEYKAIAKLLPDQNTGQISTVLDNLPEFTLNRISLEFEGGPRALLATPVSCGPATAHARFVPYGGTAVETSKVVQIGNGCEGQLPYSPTLVAGSTSPEAGKSTGFALTLGRENGNQLPGKFATTLPAGLSANLTEVDFCPSAAADVGECSPGSKIGVAVAEVGSGPVPASVPGSVYLTESYKGANFGLAIVFRAAIGPYDLGTFVVRGSLAIDPRTGQITIEHLLPTILEGVPLRFRTIGIDLNRPGFLVNPTSCAQETLVSTIFSIDGRPGDVSGPFTARGCDSLGFGPKFSASLDQRGRHASHPELSFAVKLSSKDTNLKRFKVVFPRLVKFHNSAVKEVCARGDAVEERCRPGSRVGTGTAKSPLIRGPLTGPVYLVQPKDKKGLPDLWTTVEGMGVKLQLRGESVGRGGHLNTEFIEVPDLPLSSFTMHVSGGSGKHTLFSLDRKACGGRGSLSTPVELEGHDGAYRAVTIQLKTGCSAPSRKKRSRGAR